MIEHFCRGCNKSFLSAAGDACCPQCGLDLTLREVAATMELDETSGDLSAPADRSVAAICREFQDREFDAYRVEGFLGKGGMAWVFRAFHTMLERTCAIKVLKPNRADASQESLALFLAEARAAASIVHPHIVTVHNIGTTGPYHYLELEYVSGSTLQALVEQRTRLAPREATEWLAQACSALAVAHEGDMVHRDFKPANILMSERGLAKLADFGLARRITESGKSTANEVLAGTPYYMAPELFKTVDASRRSDVYAVGVSYYYLLSGQFPFVSRNVAQLAAMHEQHPVPDIRQLCPELPDEGAQLLNECLAKVPSRRPADGQEVYERFRAIGRRLRSFSSLAGEALADLNVEWEIPAAKLSVQVPLAGARSQRVYVEDCPSPVGTEEVIRIFSVCCRVQESYVRRALELNAGIAHGALAIEDVHGQACFVMVNSYPRATCDASEIRHSVDDVARWADEVEHALTGQDRH